MDDREDWRTEAQRLAHLLAARGIRNRSVLEAIAATPRHWFVPPESRERAYLDIALGIDCGQTISQPYIVASMTEAAQLTGSETVLEIGTGSGYQAAILSRLAGRIVTMERFRDLSEPARKRLERLGCGNIEFVVGDGTLGWPDGAPYDAILVTAAAPGIPDVLWLQLAEGGRLVIPVGPEGEQSLLAIVREQGRPVSRKLCDCRFVRLIGEQGWPTEAPTGDDDL